VSPCSGSSPRSRSMPASLFLSVIRDELDAVPPGSASHQESVPSPVLTGVNTSIRRSVWTGEASRAGWARNFSRAELLSIVYRCLLS
jgi:hypothetical protein